jgi:hypothetical protein
MNQIDLEPLIQETIDDTLKKYNRGLINLEEMCKGIVQETLNNFGLFEELYRIRELPSNLLNNSNKNESKISELYKEKVVIEKRPCKKLEIKSEDCPFVNDNDFNNIPIENIEVFIKKPIELSDVIDKLNEVIRKVNEL